MKKILLFLVCMVCGVGVWLLNSESFENEPPLIESDEVVYWNYKDPLKIKISDNLGIQNYRVYMGSAHNESRLIDSITPASEVKELEIKINPPKNTMFLRDGGVEIQIIVTDSSKWGFGNSSTKTIKALIDVQKPDIEVLAHSKKVNHGGSAFVVFRASDDHLSSIRIMNGDRVFKPVYFADGGYYAALIAWSRVEAAFIPQIQAFDKAGNMSSAPINFTLLKKDFKDSVLKIGDSFIDGKITSLIEEVNDLPISAFSTQADKFNYINRDIRAKNVEIVSLVGQGFNQSSVLPIEFKLNKFYPLKNGAAVGRFGDHRFFSYNENIIGDSYHLGIDFASTKQAPILISNGGVVVFTGFNGIYGNTVIVDHGLGLMSLYGHLTQIDVRQGDKIATGTRIGTTGLTGLVLGDHVHFGVIVQGVEVNPSEWLDQKWININLFGVIKKAQDMIKSKK